MTLNAIIKRIEDTVLNHAQLRDFHHGFLSDFLNRERKYGACILQNGGGSISREQKVGTVNFKMFLLDLVHISKDSQGNELDAQSDMMSVAMDLISIFDGYQDWRIDASNNIEFVSEETPEYLAGVSMDFSVSAIWELNRCAVPIDI